ncbi:single-stranded-DNA-specific exonuclease RecJ [Paenibacillus sp. TRM 82003]|nr:single-stranded-DNA-specific exonuclease RecJ [Paenibacillus sp. TRM 82003]
MLPPKTRWSVGSPDPAYVRELSESLQIRPLLAALLAARGHTAEEAAFFLSEEYFFHDPFELHGMREATERIRAALAAREKILIYGDYDADGVSSTSLLIRLFRMLEADFTYRIPHRVEDGYGLHTHLLEKAKAEGVTLVVTVDTGITAVAEARAARELGLDLIITDHHQPPAELPDATAVVNPKLPSCGYPFKGLAGVGVAFKLAQALLGRVPEELAEWAALGTVADLMPLVGENRSIVRLGLERLRQAPPVGFAALLRVAGVQPHEASAHTIGFGLAPRINAAGRLDKPDDAVELLTTENAVEADAIARRLDALNKERQKMVETAAAEAVAMVEAAGGPGEAVVVASEQWNPGIIGIVASRLVEAYYRPTVVLAIDAESGMAKGSARAIPGFHLYEALKTCEAMFDHFGGHESAAGLSLHRDRVEAFAEALRAEAGRRLTPDMLVPQTAADAELSLADVTLDAIAELERLAPFGQAHPAPRFAIRETRVREAAVIGKDKRHAKFRIADGKKELEAVAFGFAEAVRRVAGGSRLELIGELSVNEWNGRRTPQIIVKDVAVRHRQLFDWRQATTAYAIRERWESNASDGFRPAFLLGPHDETPPELSAWWTTVPAYRLALAGERFVAPANAAAYDRPLGEATDLLLVNCPFPYERFHHILEQEPTIGRWYALSLGRYGDAGAVLDREVMKRVYVAIRELPEAAEDAWIRAVVSRAGLGAEAVRLALRAFRELALVEPGGKEGWIRAAAPSAKRDLSESPTFRLEERAGRARLEWKQASTETLLARLMGEWSDERSDDKIRTTEALG